MLRGWMGVLGFDVFRREAMAIFYVRLRFCACFRGEVVLRETEELLNDWLSLLVQNSMLKSGSNHDSNHANGTHCVGLELLSKYYVTTQPRLTNSGHGHGPLKFTDSIAGHAGVVLTERSISNFYTAGHCRTQSHSRRH